MDGWVRKEHNFHQGSQFMLFKFTLQAIRLDMMHFQFLDRNHIFSNTYDKTLVRDMIKHPSATNTPACEGNLYFYQ